MSEEVGTGQSQNNLLFLLPKIAAMINKIQIIFHNFYILIHSVLSQELGHKPLFVSDVNFRARL